MRAVVIDGTGENARFVLQDVPRPTMGPNDLLVAVRSSAINQADLRRNPTHFEASDLGGSEPVAGLEMAGHVMAQGSNVVGTWVGQRVMGMTPRAWAEEAILDFRLALRVPSAYSWAEAAAAPVSYTTAFDALHRAGHLSPGGSVLVRGATSSTGLGVVQIARHLGAGIIIGTTRSRENASELLGIGFTAVLGGSEEAVAGEVGSLVEGGVDLVIDMVGGSTINSNVLSTAIGGRIVHVGRLGGTRGSMNLDEFARRQITMKGVTFRTRSLQERIVVTRSFERLILPLMAAGVLRPRVAEEVGLEAVLEAERLLGRARRLGKVTLTVS